MEQRKGEIFMKWFKHKEFNGKRDYECTNLAYCYAPEPPNEYWQETQFPLAKITTMSLLDRQGDAQFYGWL